MFSGLRWSYGGCSWSEPTVESRLVTGGAVPAAQIRRPAECVRGWVLQDPGQGRQQQVQTRLRSTCRRDTSDTRRAKLWAADTPPIVPRRPTSTLTGRDLRSG